MYIFYAFGCFFWQGFCRFHQDLKGAHETKKLRIHAVYVPSYSQYFSSYLLVKIFYSLLIPATSVTCPSHSILLDLIALILHMYLEKSQSYEVHQYASPPACCYLISLSALFSKILSLCSNLTKGDQVSNPRKTTWVAFREVLAFTKGNL